MDCSASSAKLEGSVVEGITSALIVCDIYFCLVPSRLCGTPNDSDEVETLRELRETN